MSKPTKRDGTSRLLALPNKEEATVCRLPMIQWRRLEEKKMPERITSYLVLAPSRELVENWARKYQVNPRSLKVVQKMADVRGLADFSLVVFSGWQDRASRDHLLLGDYLLSKTNQVFFADTHDPHTNGQGVITYWVRREDDTREG